MEKAVANTPLKTSFHNLRFERKFIYLGMPPEDIINTFVLTNKFCFREIYVRRSVNNIYYDDLNRSFYKMNVSGDGLREKYRLRWYGDAFEQINNPVLEIKRKFGMSGDKFSYKLPPMQANLTHTSSRAFTRQVLKNINHPQLRASLELMSPFLYNCYERRYFLSDCKNFRITIDYNMRFYDPNALSFKQSQMSLPDVVLELKYPVALDKESRSLTQDFKVRLSKNSKYVRGCDLIYNLHP
jgi:hypothetical protein